MLKYHPPKFVNCSLERCLCGNEVILAKISLVKLEKILLVDELIK